MADQILADETRLWTTSGLDASERRELAAQNHAALDRKITYCLNSPYERVQFQRVEGWTTGRIIGYMHGRGLSLERILRDLAQPGVTNVEAGATTEPGRRTSAVYAFSRLCFKANVIEPLGDSDRFRVETPDGAFEMTKAEFRRDFANVRASRSYRVDGLYHYPVTPHKALRYRVE